MVSYRIKDLPTSERPRERLKNQGVEALSNAELLALILRTGTREKNAVQLSKEILACYDLGRLVTVSVRELKELNGVGEVKAGQIRAIFELLRRVDSHENEVDTITTFDDAEDFFRPHLSFREDERLLIACLDSQNRVLSKNPSSNTLCKGTVNGVNVEPRAVVKKALRENAAGLVLAHNHPGGSSEPSFDDVKVTEKLKGLLKEMDIVLLDHIIFGEDGCFSLKRNDLL